MLKTTVVIIEVGEDYTERLETLTLDLPQDEAAASDAAAEYVAGLGYVVRPDLCEYVSVTAPGEDYVAIVVNGQAWKVDIHEVASTTMEDGCTVSDHAADWPLIDTIYGPTEAQAWDNATRAYSVDDYCFAGPTRA